MALCDKKFKVKAPNFLLINKTWNSI
jgi:hypothetical protein